MIKIYFTSAPFQSPNTGDCDYMMQFSKIIKNFDFHFHSEILTYSLFGQKSTDLQNKYLNLLTRNIHNKQKYYNGYNIIKNDPIRINTVNNMLKYIKNQKYKHKILSLQYRSPETGTLFYPDDLDNFKKNGIIIVTTCHEFYLNVLRKYLKETTVKILNHSNLTFFFNKIDYLDAKKFGFNSNHKYTKQVSTLNLPLNNLSNTDILNRPNNILFFGLIRPKKGIQSALELALLIYENPHPNIGKVIITGKCECNNPLIRRWLSKLKSKLIDNKLNVLDKYKNVLEIKINKTDQQLVKLVNRCKYAYKPDGKGFANNSSSIINLINFGCITYTKWGPYTPDFITKDSSKYKYALRLQNNIDSNLLSNNKPLPDFVYNSIINSTQDDNLKTINAAKKLINNKYNNNIIVSKFCKNILIYLRQRLHNSHK